MASTVTNAFPCATKSVTSESVNGVTCVESDVRSKSGVFVDGMTGTP